MHTRLLPADDPRTVRDALSALICHPRARLLERWMAAPTLDLEPVLLGTSDPHEIDRALVEWAELRRVSRWAR